MATTSPPEKRGRRRRYWKRRGNTHFTIFDRNIGFLMLVLLAVFVASVIVVPQQVERSVHLAVEETLQRAGLAMLAVETDGQDVYISGELPNEHFNTEIAKLHSIARGASCEVSWLGEMVCPARVFLSLKATEKQISAGPQGNIAQEQFIQEPPGLATRQHDFSIEKSAELVTIDGEIPNEKVRDLMLSQATRASLAVIDNMRVTRKHAREFFPWALERAWAILPYLENGVIQWRDGQFSVTGRVTSEHQETVQAAYGSEFFREQLAGLKLDIRPVYNDVSTCNQAFAEVFSHDNLNFEPQSAKISTSSAGLLDQLAVLAEQCTLSFVIENHTDASAAPAADLALSQRRAEQVVAALVARGIDSSRLSAVGFGSKRLQKKNNTPIERMQNRRTYIVAK